ncbi:MAG TPA: hypothetical protein PK544_00580, partial [Spirochaetota bacterium]|nr:hypothetical protein [Spirochaetota bacterium]
MFWKRNTILIAVIMILPLIFSACGGGGGGSDSSTPDVSVVTTPDNGTTGAAATVILVGTNSDGKLPINGEFLSPSDYNSSNTAVTAADENGAQCAVTVDENGSIIVTPADGTVDGTYTVTIVTETREYELTITVTDGSATVTAAVSTPLNSSLVLNLNGGTLELPNGNTLTVTSDGIIGGYTRDSSIVSITVTNRTDAAVQVTVDEVTGDLITAGDPSGPYTIIITTSDGSVITIRTDNNGTITGISEQNSTLIVNLDDQGKAAWDGTTLTLTVKGADNVWALASGVTILSATAAEGSITLDPANIWINRTNGDIMLSGTAPTAAPVGPFEIKVSVNGKTYIIQTNTAGTITGILPGNTLLALTYGNITYCGRNIITFSQQESVSWTIMSAISDVTATDKGGNGITIQVSTANGNIVTPDSFTDPVTIKFNYTDSSDKVIEYTLVVANGSLTSYQAMITDPGSDFDFSTVTQIRVTLKAVDETTGLPIGQV